jgi:flavin reductase (DIM6/NTAB) family NADH-FMN oxidoreductase RutF
MPSSHGAERITRPGLSLLRAGAVTPPLIAERKAHLECKLESVTLLGDELVIFGYIVAASAPCRQPVNLALAQARIDRGLDGLLR